MVGCLLRTFNDRQGAPLHLLPAAADQPFIHTLHQFSQMIRIRLHDLIKLCKLTQEQHQSVNHLHRSKLYEGYSWSRVKKNTNQPFLNYNQKKKGYSHHIKTYQD